MGCFHFLTVLRNIAVDVHVQVFVWTYVPFYFEYESESGIAGLYGKSGLNLLRNCQAVSHSVCASFTFHSSASSDADSGSTTNTVVIAS